MKKNANKWLVRLIDKITMNDSPNNNYFEYYGHRVTLQSGTIDYMSVIVSDLNDRHQLCFAFDFWTKKLTFDRYNDYDERDAVILGFKNCYSRISIYDAPWAEEVGTYAEYLDNDDYDQEEIKREYNELMARKAA